ncbi:MAG: hypothetical protein NVS2B7_36370 [Herpetosiphon sp.]
MYCVPLGTFGTVNEPSAAVVTVGSGFVGVPPMAPPTFAGGAAPIVIVTPARPVPGTHGAAVGSGDGAVGGVPI